MPPFNPRPKREPDLPEPTDPNAGLVRTPFDDMHVHREQQYLQMGFSEASAAALAGARAADGLRLWPGHVRKVLLRGATHDQAVRIFV